MTNEICPKCNHKSVYFRSSTNDFVCGHSGCKKTFDKNMKEHRIQGALVDKCGNYYKINIEKEPGIIRKIETYYLEPEKTTLKGEYLKLNNDTNCKFPNRLSCNSEIGSSRCEFMEYERDGSGFSGLGGHWKCTLNR